MVAAVSTTTAYSGRQKHRPPDDAQRPPLAPSERDNGVARKPKAREISSRYLSSLTPASSARRCPSPVAARPASPSPDPVSGATPKRSQSAERRRASTPSRSSTPSSALRAVDSVKRAPEVLWPSTRSLSVSFQGESFSLPVGRRERPPAASRVPPPAATGSARKSGSTPERRRQAENSKPAENSKVRIEQQHRWPSISSGRNVLTRSLDFAERLTRDPLARVLQHSADESSVARRESFEGRVNSDAGTTESDSSLPLDLASDTESVSSSSNSASQASSGNFRRAVCNPARFLQEPATGRVARPQGFGLSTLEATPAKPRPASLKKSSDGPTSSPWGLSTPRSAASPVRGSSRAASPSKLGLSSCPQPRRIASPLRSRVSTTSLSSVSSISSRSSDLVSSILSLADVRKVKKGANHMEDAYLLRMLYNRHLQWRFVNARAAIALATQRSNAEKILRNAWMTTSELRDSVMFKRIKLHQLRQQIRLTAILQGQMSFLEDWAMLDRDHSSSLAGATEALKASTLRLPILDGARADIQSVKDAVGSAVDVMQTMRSSICHLLSKVEGMNNVASELIDVVSQEQALLGQCRFLLSMVTTLQVEEYSLRTHLLQLKQVHEASHDMRIFS